MQETRSSRRHRSSESDTSPSDTPLPYTPSSIVDYCAVETHCLAFVLRAAAVALTDPLLHTTYTARTGEANLSGTTEYAQNDTTQRSAAQHGDSVARPSRISLANGTSRASERAGKRGVGDSDHTEKAQYERADVLY